VFREAWKVFGLPEQLLHPRGLQLDVRRLDDNDDNHNYVT